MKIKNKIEKYLWALAVFLLSPFFVTAQSSSGSGEPGNLPDGSGVPSSAPAGSGGSTENSGQYIFNNPISAKSLPSLIKDIFDAIIQIGLVFVVMAIIYAGFQFVVASGNPEKLSKAKTVFLYTIIGGVILLGAQAIGDVVCNTAAQFNSNLQC